MIAFPPFKQFPSGSRSELVEPLDLTEFVESRNIDSNFLRSYPFKNVAPVKMLSPFKNVSPDLKFVPV